MAATPRGVVRRNGLPPSCHYVFAASRKISHEPSPCEIDDGGALGLGPGRPRARPPRRLAGSRTRQRPRRASDQASSSDLVPMPRNGEQSPVGAQIGIPGCPAQDPVRADLKPRSVRERGGTYRRRRLQPAKERQAKPNDSARSTGPRRSGAHPPKSGLVSSNGPRQRSRGLASGDFGHPAATRRRRTRLHPAFGSER
jgi:hypothetical protein